MKNLKILFKTVLFVAFALPVVQVQARNHDAARFQFAIELLQAADYSLIQEISADNPELRELLEMVGEALAIENSLYGQGYARTMVNLGDPTNPVKFDEENNEFVF